MIKKSYDRLGIITLRHTMLLIVGTIFLQFGIIIGHYLKITILGSFLGIIILFAFMSLKVIWNNGKIKNIKVISEKTEVLKNGGVLEFDIKRLQYNGKYITYPHHIQVDDYLYFPLKFSVSQLKENLKYYKDDENIEFLIKF